MIHIQMALQNRQKNQIINIDNFRLLIFLISKNYPSKDLLRN